MYKSIIQSFLHRLNFERTHRVVIIALRIIGALGGRAILKSLYSVTHPSLEREVLGLSFKNPAGIAAGFDVNGEVIGELSSMGFGFVEIGSITSAPQIGNPRPRVYRLFVDNAIVERLGSPNLGWKRAIEGLRKESKNVIVGCNITAQSDLSEDEILASYLDSFRNLYQYSDYFTINVSSSSQSAEESHFYFERIVAILKVLFDFRRGQSEYRPILLKVSPDLSRETLDRVAKILIDTPLDGLVAVMGSYSRDEFTFSSSMNTIKQVGSGRLSGEPLKERALEVVRYLHQATEGNYPIIGVGGISTAEDAQAMLDAGASLVQIYTSFIYQGASVVKNICQGLIKEEQTNESEDEN